MTFAPSQFRYNTEIEISEEKTSSLSAIKEKMEEQREDTSDEE